MAYDPATSTTVLFGGDVGNLSQPIGGTWTWDGSTWTQQAPATSPSVRDLAAMAYDAATGTIVLFGGFGKTSGFRDTWTWDGTTWAKQAPATSPPDQNYAAMAYDAATSDIVLFGGNDNNNILGDTWTWGG
jgi:hypothetical protein